MVVVGNDDSPEKSDCETNEEVNSETLDNIVDAGRFDMLGLTESVSDGTKEDMKSLSDLTLDMMPVPVGPTEIDV